MVAQMAGIERRFSPTMCAAKWLQSTLTLYNGHTHSCHHPPPHPVPLSELAETSSALHNTQHKKLARQQMLAGERPAECQYCWMIEDLPGQHLSDRTYKSTTQWATQHLERIEQAGASGDIAPSYLEVAFDTTCNFRCAYCSPDVSSKWLEEIEQFGAYPTSGKTHDLDGLRAVGKLPIPQRDHNPYVEAFWQWWPTVKDELQVFRLTGGEPLLSKHTWRVIDDLEAHPRPDLSFGINTNMGVPEPFIARLIAAYHRLAGKVREFIIFTSAEAHGQQAEYIRFGMDYAAFMANVRRYLGETDGQLNFMITFNALSITSFEAFLRDIYALRSEFDRTPGLNRIQMMINHLRWPPFLNVQVLPLSLRQAMATNYSELTDLFAPVERDQIARLGKFMTNELPDRAHQLQDFAAFVTEYDRRRGTDFRQTFPELADLLG